MIQVGAVWEFTALGCCCQERWEIIELNSGKGWPVGRCVFVPEGSSGGIEYVHKIGAEYPITVTVSPDWKLYESPFVSWVKKVRKEAEVETC